MQASQKRAGKPQDSLDEVQRDGGGSPAPEKKDTECRGS